MRELKGTPFDWFDSESAALVRLAELRELFGSRAFAIVRRPAFVAEWFIDEYTTEAPRWRHRVGGRVVA